MGLILGVPVTVVVSLQLEEMVTDGLGLTVAEKVPGWQASFAA